MCVVIATITAPTAIDNEIISMVIIILYNINIYYYYIMSLVGSVSLTNNTEGLYLGKVNLNGFDASANSIVYSPDGSTMKGNQLLEYDETQNQLKLNNQSGGNNNFTINLNGDTGGVNKALTSNGQLGLKWVPLADGQSRFINSDIGVQGTSPDPAQNLTIYTKQNQYNLVPYLQTYANCIFNMQISQNDELVLQLVDTDSSAVLASYTMNITGGAYQNIPVLFQFSMTANYYLNYIIQAIAKQSDTTISYDTNSYYSVYMYQIVPAS